LALAIFIGLVILGVLFNTIYRKPRYQIIFILGAWFLLFLVVTLSHCYLGVSLAPQPYRYMPELNMVVATLLGWGIAIGYDRLRQLNISRPGLAGGGFLVLAGIIIITISLPFLKTSWQNTSPQPDVSQTSEYRVSRWLSSRATGDERVYASGSHCFWLNASSGVPQVRGGTDQGATGSWWNHASYQMRTGEDGETAVLWARAFNVGYIVVNYPDSSVPYKDYAYPDKFEGLLYPMWSEEGDVIYQVPLHRPELAQVVDSEALSRLRPPRDAIDKIALEDYVRWADDDALAVSDVTWKGDDKLVIDCQTAEGEALLVQVTYSEGWHAIVDGREVSIAPDPLDFMLISPDVGKHHIELEYKDAWDVWLGRVVSLLVILGLLGRIRLGKPGGYETREDS
jgi:hypothetical protein